jgi:hypothetical protein
MAEAVINANQVQSAGPGVIYMAPLGTAVPTIAVTGGKFTHTLDPAWVPVGATDSGISFSFSRETTEVKVAERLKPIRKVTTSSAESISFAFAQFNDKNWKYAQNGGTWTTTGSGATGHSKYSPAALGDEVRSMLLWVNQTEDIMFIAYQVFQTGSLSLGFSTTGEKTVLECEFTIEEVAGDDYNLYIAGENHLVVPPA